uniref:mucin-7-like n=1 Tax=Ictidomys tridecemlineatus TaxID=43179 RepID=UPI001A9F4F02|nr:mucin-7-like [Ictidomys tridecemlineatus]
MQHRCDLKRRFDIGQWNLQTWSPGTRTGGFGCWAWVRTCEAPGGRSELSVCLSVFFFFFGSYWAELPVLSHQDHRGPSVPPFLKLLSSGRSCLPHSMQPPWWPPHASDSPSLSSPHVHPTLCTTHKGLPAVPGNSSPLSSQTAPSSWVHLAHWDKSTTLGPAAFPPAPWGLGLLFPSTSPWPRLLTCSPWARVSWLQLPSAAAGWHIRPSPPCPPGRALHRPLLCSLPPLPAHTNLSGSFPFRGHLLGTPSPVAAGETRSSFNTPLDAPVSNAPGARPWTREAPPSTPCPAPHGSCLLWSEEDEGGDFVWVP